jgi:DUF4097 and DUF4098 domain-containing protein YvlB
VKVSGWGGSDEEFIKSCEPQFSETGDTIRVQCDSSFHFTFGWRTTEAKIDVKMPPGMRLDASSGSGDCSLKGEIGGFPVAFHSGSGDAILDGACKSFTATTGSGDIKAAFTKDVEITDLHTGSGDITVAGPVGDLSVETGSGDVRADLTGGKARASLRSGSGDLTLKGGAAELNARSGSGSITAEGLTGPATLKTSSGEISARWAGAPRDGKVSVRSSSGGVRLAFPAGTTFQGLLDTTSGDVLCDFPGTLNSRGQTFAFSGPQGSAELTVETASGDIQVSKAL